MKRMIKRFSFLTALVALFALLTVAAYADEPAEPADPASDTKVDLSLVFAPETDLTVYVDNQWSSALSNSYGYGDKATITAPGTSGSKTFSHWTANGSIVSYANPLTLTMNAHTTLYAVYASDAPTEAAVAGFTSITRTNDGGSISFQAIAYPNDGEITSAGIVYSTSVTGEDLKIDGTGVTNVEAVKYNAITTGESATLPESILDGNNCWMLKITPNSENKDTVYHARAYVKIGTEPIYGDVKDVKLSGLQSGMRQVANLEGFEPGINDLLADIANDMQARNNNGGSGSTTKTITAPVTGENGTVSVTTTVKGNDATIAPLTTEQLDSIVGSGTSGNQSSTVAIDVSNLGTQVNSVTIPADTMKAIEAAVSDTKKDADSLTVKLSEGSITFDADAVKAITEETKNDGLKVNLDDIGTEKLNTAQKSAVSDLAVETVLDAYVTSGSTRISDFKGGSATVSVKHTLKASQSSAGIVVWYVADNGTRTQIPAYFRNGEVVFTVTHFSNYVIAYDAEKAAAAGKLGEFTDLDSNAWYADGVLWALDNGVMNGWANPLDAGMLFGPSDTSTRAMVATMLWRLEGSPVVSGEMKFVDVSDGTWYTEAVRWAASTGIITGYKIPTATTPWPMGFDPDKAVTREQLATMLYRYAQYKKADVSVSADLGSFSDAATVSDWATSAMQWAVGSGIINGMDGSLAPAGNATRAQVAMMLMRYSTAK